MIFPDRPLCHSTSSVFKIHDHMVWRPPDLTREPSASPFRTCGYCGSMHPEDLYHALRNGASLHGSDWKYGWPHKFYVENIPNPLAGKHVQVGSRSYPILRCPHCHAQAPDVFPIPPTCIGCGGMVARNDYIFIESRTEPTMGIAPEHAFAKFYSEHLNDLVDPETFSTIAEVIYDRSQVMFMRVDGQLKYHAPRYGYQA
jgi:hypothetical protein